MQSELKDTLVQVSPSLPLSFASLGEYGWKAVPHLTALCCGQHPQPPSLASVDLEKLHYKVWPTNAPLFFRHCSEQCLFSKYITISIKLKYSKTDQFRKGVKLVMGRTNDNLCTVTALLSYLIHHGDAPGPLFQWDNHTPLSKSKFVDHVHHALLAANVPAHLNAGHSSCIGAATTAASAGIEDSTIQTLGCWKSSSYLLYISWAPLIWQMYPPPWHSALFNCHRHLQYLFVLIIIVLYLYLL